MQDRPFPFDPRLLYVGMTHQDVYYEVRFLRLSLRGYVDKRRQPTFWLLGTLREQIINRNFEFDTDLSRIKPWFC